MKTAREIMDEEFTNSMLTSLNRYELKFIKDAMVSYARQSSEQALKDAANKFSGIEMRDNYGCVCDVPSAILSTEIKIP